jgi:hypothetical protein
VELFYRGVPAADIAFDGTSLWFTATKIGMLVRYGLTERKVLLRVGGHAVFQEPRRLFFRQGTLCVCCGDAKKGVIHQFDLSRLAVLGKLTFPQSVRAYCEAQGRPYIYSDDTLYAVEDAAFTAEL